MSAADIRAVVLAVVLVLLAALLAAAESAFARVSAASVSTSCPATAAGCDRLDRVVADRARYVNVALFGQLGLQITAVVLVTRVALDRIEPGGLAVLVTAVVMLLVSFVLLGVAPRTLGRQHALAGRQRSRPCRCGLLAAVLAPLTQAADPARQRAHARAAASARARSPPRPSCASWSTWPSATSVIEDERAAR